MNSNIRTLLTSEQVDTLREGAGILAEIYREIQPLRDDISLACLSDAQRTLQWAAFKFGPWWLEGCQGASEGRTGDV